MSCFHALVCRLYSVIFVVHTMLRKLMLTCSSWICHFIHLMGGLWGQACTKMKLLSLRQKKRTTGNAKEQGIAKGLYKSINNACTCKQKSKQCSNQQMSSHSYTRGTPLILMPSAQNGNSCNFVKMWVATLVLDVAALALHSWLHMLQRMHASNATQRVVIACTWQSHQMVMLQQTNLIVKSSTPTITLGIRCWMHQTQRLHPYFSSVCKKAT